MGRLKTVPPLSEMTQEEIDRWGLAYCRANCWEWDELFGEKPDGFDDMPTFARGFWQRRKYKNNTKRYWLEGWIIELRYVLGEETLDRCWKNFVSSRRRPPAPQAVTDGEEQKTMP